jgi:hypothetical protein
MPMDRSRLRRLINKHIKWLRWTFQLNQWEVNTSVERIDDEATAAQCKLRPKYRSMDIDFDAEKVHSEAEAFNHIRHEMLHGMLAEFDLLYEAIQRVAPQCDMDLLDVIYHNAVERSVGNIERMIDHGLGLEGTKLIDRAKEVCKEREG